MEILCRQIVLRNPPKGGFDGAHLWGMPALAPLLQGPGCPPHIEHYRDALALR